MDTYFVVVEELDQLVELLGLRHREAEVQLNAQLGGGAGKGSSSQSERRKKDPKCHCHHIGTVSATTFEPPGPWLSVYRKLNAHVSNDQASAVVMVCPSSSEGH